MSESTTLISQENSDACGLEADPLLRPLRVGVLTNPLSGGNRRGGGAVRKVLTDHPKTLNREVQTPSDVALALADFAHKDVDVVVINGGDGTVQAALTALFGEQPFTHQPLLAVLSSGTTSMIAGDVTSGGTPARALRKILSWASARKKDRPIRRRHVLRMQGAAGREAVFGMFFAAAGLHQAIQFCMEKIEPLGLRGAVNPALALCWYLLALVRGRKDFLSAVPVQVGVNGKAADYHNCLLLFVSTVQQFPLGLRPYWGTEPGPLHYTALTAEARQILRVLPSLLRGRRHPLALPEHGYFSHNVREVSLTLQSGFYLDGQPFLPASDRGPVVLKDAGEVSFLRV